MLHLPLVIGHRGAKAGAPENTLASIIAARRLGATWVELDVHLSRDRVPVVIHDATLDRTTNGLGPVAETDWIDLSRLDAGAWYGPDFVGESIPSLAQALAVSGQLGLGVNLEIKAGPTDAATVTKITLAVAQAAAAASAEADAAPAGLLVSSFEPLCLAEARDLAPSIPRGLLLSSLSGDWRALIQALEPTAVIVNHQQLEPDRIAALAATGPQVMAYTVNDPDRARQLWGWGVASVITDVPSLLLATRKINGSD